MSRTAGLPRLGAAASSAKAVQPSAPSVRPPALPSMRVPKGTIAHDDGEAEHEWHLRAHEANARIEAEQREWQAQIARVKALLAAAEESEWQALRAKKLESARMAEEREWQECLARARANSIAAPSRRSAPSDARAKIGSPARPRAATPREERPVVVYWP